jgi:hypothetical protein
MMDIGKTIRIVKGVPAPIRVPEYAPIKEPEKVPEKVPVPVRRKGS